MCTEGHSTQSVTGVVVSGEGAGDGERDEWPPTSPAPGLALGRSPRMVAVGPQHAAGDEHERREEHRRHGINGEPFLSCRVTQLYPTGVCVYFYYAFHYKGLERPSEVYAAIEHAAREEILAQGGSLSHHHGVGKLRAEFLPDVLSPTAMTWNAGAKRAVDPHNVFGTGNHGVDRTEAEQAATDAELRKRGSR